MVLNVEVKGVKISSSLVRGNRYMLAESNKEWHHLLWCQQIVTVYSHKLFT
jgi:hypothetical protein